MFAYMSCILFLLFFFSSRRRHTSCALVTGVQTCALPITSIDPMVARLVGMSLSTGPGVACYIPVAHRGPDKIQQLSKEQVLERLRPWLEDPAAHKLLHNATYDAHVFLNEGVALAGIAGDSMLQAYVLESHPIGRA